MSVGTNGNLPKRKPPGSRPIVTAATLPPGGGRPLVEHIDTFVARVQAYFSKLYLNPDEAYKQTRDHGASMRRDPVVMEPLRQRQLATALLDFQICPEDEGDVIQKAVCEDLKLCVQRTPYWTKMLMCLQEAIWFGKYAVNMYGYQWDRFNPWRMLPGEWIPVHGDKLKFEHETGRVGIRISSLANLSDRSDFRIDTEGRVVMVPDEWLSAGDRKALIVHKHEIEDGDFFDATTAGSIHGVGLRTRVYWPWFFKQKAVQWLMSWAEQVGLGVKIWYFEQSNPESEAAVRRAAEQNNENMNILMPRSIGTEGQGAGLELLEPSSGGAQFLQDLADKYWGDQIKRMIVGQTLTSQTAPTGMGSEVGKQHRETFDQLVKYDALNLAETISQQMLSVLVDYGYPGITWEPRFEFVLEEQDPRELMEAAKLFIDMGGEASEDEIRDIAGLKKPQKGEKVLGGKAALAAQQQPGMPPQDDGEPKEPLNLDALAAERQGEPVRFKKGPQHSPPGGVTLHGIFYPAGQWIPDDVVESMTDKQRAVLQAHTMPPPSNERRFKDDERHRVYSGYEVPEGEDVQVGKQHRAAGGWIHSHEISGMKDEHREAYKASLAGRKLNRTYRYSDGSPLHEDDLKELESLKIRPDLADIEVLRDEYGGLKATGKDSKGRTQPIYTTAYRARKDAEKFERVRQFVSKLDDVRNGIREGVASDNQATREAAMVAYLIDKTGMRVGGEKDTGADVKATGATTLQADQVRIEGSKVFMDFIGKSAHENHWEVDDSWFAEQMAERVARGGRIFETDAAKVRDFVKSVAGDDFKVKDFRTATAADHAITTIAGMKPPTTAEEYQIAVAQVAESVAARINNTPQVSYKSYIPPEVFGTWQAELARRSILFDELKPSFGKTPTAVAKKSASKTQPSASQKPTNRSIPKTKPTKPQTQAQLFRRMTWAEFSNPIHFARRKPAAGQQSLSWDESEHPREGDGKFAEKEGGATTATAEPDEPFSLTTKPAKPARKPAEPHKDTAEQDHLFAGSDWKPGQEELFDPEGDEPEQPKDEPKPKKEKPKQLIVDAAQTWFGEGKRLSKMTNIQMNVMLDSFTKYPDDYGLTHGEAFTIGAALDGVQHAMNTGRLSGQSEQWWRALNVPEKLKVVQKVIAKAGAMKASGDYYESFRDLAIKESEKGI